MVALTLNGTSARFTCPTNTAYYPPYNMGTYPLAARDMPSTQASGVGAYLSLLNYDKVTVFKLGN